MKRKRPLILLTNDDGVHAPGLAAACEAVGDLGEAWVVAPLDETSSIGHAVTLMRPIFRTRLGPRRFGLSGTPADAVFIACSDILPRMPDLVISGINNGCNLGKDTFYSGTVAAAREAAFRGIPAMAVSVEKGGPFDAASALARITAAAVLAGRGPKVADPERDGALLVNINVPSRPVRALRVTRLGRRIYGDHVVKRRSPRGHVYYWINGGATPAFPGRGTDGEALSRGFASMTFLDLDQTADSRKAARWRRIVREVEKQWSRRY
jgi:5'-nucleotidase